MGLKKKCIILIFLCVTLNSFAQSTELDLSIRVPHGGCAIQDNELE